MVWFTMLSSPSHLALCCHVSGLMQFPDKLACLVPCAVFAHLSLWFSCKAFLTFQYPSSCSASQPWLVPLWFFTVPCWGQSFLHCIAKMWSLECFATEPPAGTMSSRANKLWLVPSRCKKWVQGYNSDSVYWMVSLKLYYLKTSNLWKRNNNNTNFLELWWG